MGGGSAGERASAAFASRVPAAELAPDPAGFWRPGGGGGAQAGLCRFSAAHGGALQSPAGAAARTIADLAATTGRGRAAGARFAPAASGWGRELSVASGGLALRRS